MHIAIGAVVVFIAALSALLLGISRLKENGAAIEHATRELILRLQSLEEKVEQMERFSFDHSEKVREFLAVSAREERSEVARNFSVLGDLQTRNLRDVSAMQKSSLDALALQIARLSDDVDKRLLEIRTGNEEKLEKMRAVVDEKLNATLEQRLGAAFANVSGWLDRVHAGLGEMKNLAGDVGDLRRVLTNVKVRGIWGEIQLASLLEQVMNREQYGENVSVVPGSAERVEFAVKLPGRDDSDCVWLPIDSKFPQEDYLRLADASERGDAKAVAEHRKALESRIVEEAKKIRSKYIEPPYTTDFAILFLPAEGLYAEVIRIDGLCEKIMRDFRVVASGPATIAALLNSLQLGFRTLAVEKRSSEVWVLLGQIKTEFAKFGGALKKAHDRIEQAGRELENAGARSRAIEKKLVDVAEMPQAKLGGEPDESVDTEVDAYEG